VAKVKVVNNTLDSNLNGLNFNNTASEIIFSFGSFAVTSNFDGRTFIDYNNELSTFVQPVTLETMVVSDTQSDILYQRSTNVVLNLNKSDLNTFVRFGSAYEFLRISIENIILNYPPSLYINSQISRGGNLTFYSLTTDTTLDTATFNIPSNCIVNIFGLVYNNGNITEPDDVILKNLNLSFEDYVVWLPLDPDNNYPIIGFTGNSTGINYLTIKTQGNPFSIFGDVSSGSTDLHLKPNNLIFEEFRASLTDYEKYIISERYNNEGFRFTLKNPTLLDDGDVTYSDTSILWTTSDKYNIDINTPDYQKFLDIILTIGTKYDSIKTDLIVRFLTPTSLKIYDLTEEGKMTKLLRVCGREFDQVRQFIDSLTYINKITYDKINNIPDQLIKNLAKTLGWNYFSLVNENELADSLFTIDENERNLNTDLLPAEVDIELWRRILINTNYFWKSKGTREAIKSIFLLIGIPEPFINITEYVYTVDGVINPNTVTLSQADFPSNSLPYDTEGYPTVPLEIKDFYFQLSGNSDSGQAYMDVFRMAGFNLIRTVDNKKSWIQTGSTTRIHNTTPQYYQEDSKLVLNTKEVDVALDTARGIEYDVYRYIKEIDFPANSSGYTLPFSYINISLGVGSSQTTFTLPVNVDELQGDFEVRYNGILLNAPKTGTTSGISTGATGQSDYVVNGNTFTLTNPAINVGGRRDVIQATYIYSGGTTPVSGITVEYIVTRVKANLTGTYVPLPSYPRGDIQVTINGIALTKGTNQFTADYILDPTNTTGSSQIIIQNQEVISYLAANPEVQVAYVKVEGTNNINARSEVIRIDSFNTNKIYYNTSANKYVYKLNYKVTDTANIKVLIDGIALEPDRDYTLNTINPYEIFLPRGLRYGMVISIYYLIASSEYFNPIIADVFGIGDISNLSFLEFIELVQRKMINARNRKIVTDFKNGWYPALLNIYNEYLKRTDLSNTNPLKSNGYTFQNLYSFLSKYNSFFQNFVDQLLSATIILRRSGLLVRNTIFTKQKFVYKRGVNLYQSESTTTDTRGNLMIQYLGDDDSVFWINQDLPTPPPPVPPTLFVKTVDGFVATSPTFVMIITGGENILGNDVLTEFGIKYRKWYDVYPYGDAKPIGFELLLEGETIDDNDDLWGGWLSRSYTGSLASDHFTTPLTGLEENTTYQYKAYVMSSIYGFTGSTLTITTPFKPVPTPTPSIQTRSGSAGVDSIMQTGGINIVGYESIDYYGMQYRVLEE